MSCFTLDKSLIFQWNSLSPKSLLKSINKIPNAALKTGIKKWFTFIKKLFHCRYFSHLPEVFGSERKMNQYEDYGESKVWEKWTIVHQFNSVQLASKSFANKSIYWKPRIVKSWIICSLESLSQHEISVGVCGSFATAIHCSQFHTSKR